MHRPKPVVQPVTLRLDRVIVRVDRLLRNRLILPRLVIPLTPKPPHQSLPPRLNRNPRPPIPRPLPLHVPAFSHRSLLSAHSFLNPSVIPASAKTPS